MTLGIRVRKDRNENQTLFFFMTPPQQSAGQDEAEYLLPGDWLSDTHRSGSWRQALRLLWEEHGHRSNRWCSGWRVEWLYGLKSTVGRQTRFPMKQDVFTRDSVNAKKKGGEGHFCYGSRKTGEGKQKSVCGYIWMPECPQLGYLSGVRGTERGYSWTDRSYWVLVVGAQSS